MEEKMSSKPVKNMGKIVVENGEYFLEIGRGSQAQKHPLGPFVESIISEKMVGKSVELIMSSGPKPYVVGAKIQDLEELHHLILCYYPRDMFGRIDGRMVIPLMDEKMRINIAKKLLDEKVIAAEDYERMVHL